MPVYPGAHNREHVQLARTQRTERLRLQAIAPDGEGGHTPWLRPLGRDAIQAQVREPAPEYSAIARKTRESAGTYARNGATRSGWKRAAFARGGLAAENRGVGGSSPPLAIKTLLQIRCFAALCEACEKAGKGRSPFRDRRLRGKCPAGTGLHAPRSTRCVSCAGAAALGGSQLRSDR
jgi:hypothetical protein